MAAPRNIVRRDELGKAGSWSHDPGGEIRRGGHGAGRRADEGGGAGDQAEVSESRRGRKSPWNYVWQHNLSLFTIHPSQILLCP